MALYFVLLVVLTTVAAGFRSTNVSPVYEECTTPSCLQTAQLVLEFLNTSVDPCENFYQYACGGWIDKNPIPDDRVSYMTYEVLRDKVSGKIVDALREVTDESHTRAVYDASALYKGCVNEDAREETGLDPLKYVIDFIGGWPISEPEWEGSDYIWYSRVAQITRELSLASIIGVGADVDANKTSQHAIYIVQPSLRLGRNQLVNPTSEENEPIVLAYKNYIINVAKLLNPNANEDQLEQDASDLLNFEINLAVVSKPPEEKRSAKSWYNKMTVAEVQKTTENDIFLWTDFLNDVFRDFPGITDETEVILTDGDYLKKALKLISKAHPRTLANYIGWSVVSNLGIYTNEEFRQAKFRFDKVMTGVRSPPKLDRMCTDLVISLMGFAVGRLYIDKHFAEAEKVEVEDFVEDVRSAYRDTLRNNEWMDEITTSKALDKLDAMAKLIGYPQWILDDDMLSKYYENASGLNEDEFFASALKAARARLQHTLGKWNKPADRTQWKTSPAVVNAFYSPSANSIIFPAAILDFPYYEYGGSLPLNFGGIGSVIGHELSHGFDDQGSEYGPNGNLLNWWTNETRAKFNEKADCFREQYSSYVEPTTNLTLNGNNSVGENIADNGAVRNAFLGFKLHMMNTEVGKYTSKHVLPGVQATPDQLFFIGRAMTYCGSERKESLAMKIQYQTHTPSEFRVRVPLTNSKEFSQVFGCQLGSPMNPVKKCQLW